MVMGLTILGLVLLAVAYLIYDQAVKKQKTLPLLPFGLSFVSGGTCLLVAGSGLVG